MGFVASKAYNKVYEDTFNFTQPFLFKIKDDEKNCLAFKEVTVNLEWMSE